MCIACKVVHQAPDTALILLQNGKHVGGQNGCLPYRAYPLDLSDLKVDNVVAVRVHSGDGQPGGLCDSGALAMNGVSVASGGDWEPPSPFDPARSPNGRSYGYSVDGAGWYRKTFTHMPSHLIPHERISVQFDGVYMNSDMYINDVFLGNHPYGYTQINYDITEHLKEGQNVLAVRVRNLGRNSRWYSGSGIFRHVHLITTPALHIGLWGVVTRTEVADDRSSATVSVSVLCENNGTAAVAHPGLTVTIVDATGKTVAARKADVPAVSASSSVMVNITGIMVKNPTLWDSTPNGGTDSQSYMYSVKVALASSKSGADGATVDTRVVPFGIRTISFTADGGFELNGKKMNLQGGCVHHDNGRE